MSTERLEKALIAADAAGDVDAARRLARAIREARGSAPAEAPVDPSAGGGTLSIGPWDTGIRTPQAVDRTLAGAGKFLYDIGRGAKQITGQMSREEVDERKALDAPLMATTAGKVGNIGGGIAFSAPLGLVPGINTVAGAALAGAGMGAIQPVGTDDSRTFNTILGGAGGVAGKYVGDKIGQLATRPAASASSSTASRAQASVSPGQSAAQTTVNAVPEVRATGGGYTFGSAGDDASAGLTRGQREIMERGRALGMRVTPGQATGSRALQQLEAKLESQPMTSGPFNDIKANNARVLAKEAARAIGETSDTLDAPVLDRAFTRIGNVFDDAADDVPRTIDPRQFLQHYSQVQDDIRGLVSGFDQHPLVEDLVKLSQNGQATGKQLQSLTSKLGRAAYKQMTTGTGDRDLGLALYRMKDYVDDLLVQGMDPKRASTFQAAREQYRNLMLLTSRVGIVNPSTGDVSGRSLANILQSKDKAGFLRGKNQSGMYDAARFAQAFQPIVGDSGTATRMPLQGVTDLVARIPLNIATRAYTSSPGVNLAVGAQAGAQAASNAAGSAMRPILGPFAPYAPYYLPGAGGVLATYPTRQ